MATASIQIILRSPGNTGGVHRFAPGDPVSGSVDIRPDGDVHTKHVYVRLTWHTEGHGDRNQEKVAEQDVFQGTLRAGAPNSFDFNFALPPEPWSYAGHYIKIVWEIDVDVDVAWSRNPRERLPLVMAPVGWQVDQELAAGP